MDDYSDIINLKRPESKKHPKMSNYERSAQFSPFAALTGHSDAIEETARLTSEERLLTEDEKEIINEKLNIILSNETNPLIKITYFEDDDKKEGGEYITLPCHIKKIDDIERKIITTDLDEIAIDKIYNIEGEVLDSFDFI